MAGIKKKAVKKEQPVIEVEAVGKVEKEEAEEFIPAVTEGIVYSIKLDNKRMDNRTAEQVIALVQGSLGAVKKIVIENE